jgi:hypothetical protein
MTCRFEYDEAGNLKRIACGHPWGIGTITLHGEAAEDYGDCMYGYPKADTKPEDFRPDLEAPVAKRCCGGARRWMRRTSTSKGDSEW